MSGFMVVSSNQVKEYLKRSADQLGSARSPAVHQLIAPAVASVSGLLPRIRFGARTSAACRYKNAKKLGPRKS